MKLFEPLNWNEVKPNVENKAQKGRLQLRCSKAVPLYLQAHGIEALFGVADAFDLQIAEAMTFKVDGDCRVFQYYEPPTSQEIEGEVYTNIDRMAEESGNLLEVRKALRELQIAQHVALGEIRAERQALKYSKAKKEPAVEPGPDPAAKPASDPAAKPAPDPAAEPAKVTK